MVFLIHIVESNMLSKLVKLARKFSSIINAQDVPFTRFPEGKPSKIEPEMTEDLNDIVTDSLHLVILIKKIIMDFQSDIEGSDNKNAHKFVSNALIDVEDIEDALNNPELLNFDLNLDTSYLDVVNENISMLKMVLDLTRGNHGKVMPGFEILDLTIFKLVNELIENSDKLYDAVEDQYPEKARIHDKPIEMREKDERDPDEIHPSEIHPALLGDEEHFSGDAFYNEEWVNSRGRPYKDKDEYDDFEQPIYHNHEDD